MQRTVSAELDLVIHDRTRLVFSIAAARGARLASESLAIALDGRPVEVHELDEAHGTRLHHLESGPGRLTVRYDAVVDGRADAVALAELDEVVYLRPSRYCPSDALTPTARERFGDLDGLELVQAVRDWVHDRTAYVSGSSSPTDSALDTLLSRQGVCRDFAHLVIALLRALDVPARLVSVYAPGLAPMDFHAVVEAAVDGRWVLVDATGLAPRESMLRIATGRDAADTAFLTNTLADLELTALEVTATADALPDERPDRAVELG